MSNSERNEIIGAALGFGLGLVLCGLATLIALEWTSGFKASTTGLIWLPNAFMLVGQTAVIGGAVALIRSARRQQP
jgi:hypothetical protein